MNLAGDQIKDTYGALLNIGASGALSTLQPVTDGFGNVFPFELSTTTFNFTGNVTGGPIGPTGAAGTSGTSGVSGSSGTSGTDGTSGTSGTSGASGSSGTSGTSGASGTSGTSGVNGATGAGASSPITLEQTNSLVATAIGATATSGSFNSVVIGATATAAGPNQIAIGPNINKTNPNPGQNKIAIGFNIDQSAAFTSCKTIEIGCHTAGATPLDSTGIIIGFDNNPSYGAGSITVGNTNSRHSTGSLTFGNNNCGWDNTIIFGSCNRMFAGLSGNVIYGCNNVPNNVGGTIFGKDNTLLGANSLLIGISNFDNGGGGGQRQTMIGQCNINCTAALQESTVVGSFNQTCNLSFPSCAQTILGENNCKIGDGTSYCHSLIVGSCNKHIGNVGNCTSSVGHFNTVFPGATGTIVLGNSSVGGTGACNSVVIGNTTEATGKNSVVIGQSAKSTAACGIAIGNSVCSTSSGIAIGNGAISTASEAIAIGNLTAAGTQSIGIGYNINSLSSNSVNIGRALYGGVGQTIMIGDDLAAANGGIAIGFSSRATAASTITIGNLSGNNTHANSVLIGANGRIGTNETGTNQVSIGQCNIIDTTGNCNTIIGGFNNCLTGVLSGVALIGLSGLTGGQVRNDTTHVNSLVAFGQAASKTNAVGSTGGSVTLNWDNSNIQTLTLTSSITTLTKSNPIDGAVYTLFLTQGGSGGYTVDFGADVNFAGGTGPTLSTAIGATDAVSLVYIAGITGYYGNANLNFA
jgi:hypothetical protein